MIQLTYQPAFDSYHATYRFLRLYPLLKKRGPIHRDHLRVLDYYLLFPARVKTIRLMPKHQRYKRLTSTIHSEQPFVDQPDDEVIFSRMRPMQLAALATLATKEYFDEVQLVNNSTVVTNRPVPKELTQRIDEANSQESILIEFLDIFASEYQFMGPNGVKARAGLMEYRYDAI